MSRQHAIKLYHAAQIARGTAVEAARQAEVARLAAEDQLDALHQTYQYLVPISPLFANEDGLAWTLSFCTLSGRTNYTRCAMVYIDNKVCVYSVGNAALRRFYDMPEDRALWPERLLKVQQYFSKYLLNHMYPDKALQLCLNPVLPDTTLVTQLETAFVPAAETLATLRKECISEVVRLTRLLTNAERSLLAATTREELLTKKHAGAPLSAEFLTKWGKYNRGKGC